MIVWVDEEERTTYPSRLLLKKEGYSVLPIANATDGYQEVVVQMENKLDLVIIDVMLLQGDDLETFSDVATLDGVVTGLILAKKLIIEHDDFPWNKKMVIFSRASDKKIVDRIDIFSAKYGIKYIQKSKDFRATKFMAWLKKNRMIQ